VFFSLLEGKKITKLQKFRQKKGKKKKKTIWDVMLISILGVDLVLVKP